MKFPQKLSLLISRRDISQSKLVELANHPNLNQSAISELTRDVRRPYLDQAFALAKALGVSVDYLADEDMENEPRSLSADEIAVLATYRSLKESKGIDLQGALDRLNGDQPFKFKATIGR
jgi:transcriptional regulator with XRE-family HTH domain